MIKYSKMMRSFILNFLFLCLITFHCHAPQSANSDGWQDLPAILSQIIVPQFPDQEFRITDFGAIGDSLTDCHAAIMQTIQQCNSAGGGRVVIPPGIYLTNGPIHLKGNVHLIVSEGARIKFGSNPEYYLPAVLTRWEGTELYNYSPLIYAYQVTNIAISGKGTIDGNATTTFATWKPNQRPAQELLRQMGNDCVPVNERVFGNGHWLRPSMIQPYGCKNILIEGVTIVNSPFWVIHPVFCTNVTVRNVKIESWNKNNDGCDPDASVNILIEGCVFNTGDDAIAIKSGRDQDGWRFGQATENVIIRNCEMNSIANGLCIGSEMSGGVRNVFMENCHVHQAGNTIYFKSNLDRGGTIENVWVRNVTVDTAKSVFIRFETNYKGYRGNHHPPVFRNLKFEHLTCQSALQYAIYAVGHPEACLQQILISDVKVHRAMVPMYLRFAQDFITDQVYINGILLPSKPDMSSEESPRFELAW